MNGIEVFGRGWIPKLLRLHFSGASFFMLSV
jgi:hypothetical protein